MLPSLLDECVVSRVMNAVAAGTSDQNGSSVDMAGFDGVLFVLGVGTLTATQVTSLKAQHSSDNSSFSDIEGSAVGPLADGDSNKLLVLDVVRPRERYVRPVVDRGTANAVIDGILAIQYRARSKPTSQGSTVSASDRVVDAPAGTA